MDSILTVTRQHDASFVFLRTAAAKAAERVEQLSGLMDRLCEASCPDCTDICCARATVWYDFKDLLFMQFSGQQIPSGQIQKVRDSQGKSVCVNLTPKGCGVPRSQRPFICTWYICPAQKRYIDVHCSARKTELWGVLDRIKVLRCEIENSFIEISSNQTVSGGNEL